MNKMGIEKVGNSQVRRRMLSYIYIVSNNYSKLAGHLL